VSELPYKSPNDELAAEIVNALVKARLVDPSQMEKAQDRIATGTMKREDWRLLLDPKRPKRGRTTDNA
jgi:hypothetical protein